MNSGIYQLTFSSGYYYVGRSYNVYNRYEQHIESMREGSAARPLQGQFAASGVPKLSVLCSAHVDYLPWLESYYINKLDGPMMLNTTKSVVDYDPSKFPEQIYGMSLNETLEFLVKFQKQSKSLMDALEDVMKERTQEEIEADVYNQIKYYQDLVLDNKRMYEEEVSRLKSRNLWQRIWNL